jgi:hypothetical protein
VTAGQAAGLGVLGFAAFWLLKQRDAQLLPGIADTSLGLGYPQYPRKIEDLAAAIARAEGFYVPGSIPARAHNPGNLKSPTWTYPGEYEGQTLGTGIAVFSSDGAGWNALKRQLMLIVEGESANYTLSMTLRQMGTVWTGNTTEGGAWSNNVGLAFGVNPSTTLGAMLA